MNELSVIERANNYFIVTADNTEDAEKYVKGLLRNEDAVFNAEISKNNVLALTDPSVYFKKFKRQNVRYTHFVETTQRYRVDYTTDTYEN